MGSDYHPSVLAGEAGDLLVAPPGQSDERELTAYLAGNADSSMYLRAAMHRSRERHEFVVARLGGGLVGAAMRSDTGMIVLQAPVGAGELAKAILARSSGALRGFLGPITQVRIAMRQLGLERAALLKDTEEDLFALPISKLHAPAALSAQLLRCRVAVDDDFDLLVAWRAAFRAAALNEPEGVRLLETSRSDIAALLPARSLFILESDQPVACCSFNARLPDIVQVGNVWTPPALRGKGYARAVVAGALTIAAAEGVTRAVLTTGRHNAAAQAAYRNIGFQAVGDYATVIFAS